VKREVTQLKLAKNDQIRKEIFQENTGAEKNKLFPTDLGACGNGFPETIFYQGDGFRFHR
jgi:DNA topoisomerase-1